MISASEARTMSKNNEIIPFILREADVKVKESARQGKFSALYCPDFELNYSIFSLILPSFTELGYKLCWFNNTNTLLISWGEEV